MNNKTLTGNALLDKLLEGPYSKNPNYNPKTKAGRSQPQVLVDTNPGDINGGGITNAANKLKENIITGSDLGFTNEEINKLNEDGYALSNNISQEDLNKAYAENQSAAAQFGDFLMQAGIGEVILGTFEGFGNIVDGVINSFTGDQYGVNPYTEFMHKTKEEFNNNFKIYQENPNAAFQLSDPGWWAQNAVSIFSTASLMLPAMGWARALSTTGKLGAVRGLVRGASKGIAKGASTLAKTTKFSALNKLAKPGRIEESIYSGSKILTQATLSRAGENFMEARETYDTVYADIKENLDNMPDSEYAKFINNNPEFKNVSKDDVAKEIARQSANKTFYNDWWMLLMDIPQFKALGSLWGKGARTATTSGQRIAAENVKREMAGASADKLIKDNLANRVKYHYKHLLKNPKELLTSLELTEGFEELYQGIQSEKGLEVAEKYFNPNFTPRTISSYLSDGHIWEQFVWGAIGGIAFGKIGRGVQKASRQAEALWNKKHMTAEEYEKWKTSDNKIAINQINNITGLTNKFIEDMKDIENNVNPYNFTIDKETGRMVIKNGESVKETIDDDQKELLKQQAIDKFVVDTALESIDRGNFDLIKDIIGSEEFNKFIEKGGFKLSSTDKALSQQVVERMDEIADIYKTELRDVNALADTTNPYVTIMTARDITRSRLLNEDYDRQLDNISVRLAEVSNGNDYDSYRDRAAYSTIRKLINNLQLRRQFTKARYDNGDLGKTAYDQYNKEIDNDIKALLNYLTNNTTKGLLDSVKKSLVENDLSSTIDEFNKFAADYEAAVFESDEETPPESVLDLYNQQVEIEARKAFTTAKLPINKEDYQDIYNEYANAMDAHYKEKMNNYIETIKKYLSKQENTEDTVRTLLNGRTDDSKVNEAIDALKYGYIDVNNSTKASAEKENNRTLNKIINDFLNNKNKADERAKAAEEIGLTLPDAKEEKENKDKEKSTEKSDDSVPSTGRQPEDSEDKSTSTDEQSDDEKLGETDKGLNNDNSVVVDLPFEKNTDEELTKQQQLDYEKEAANSATNEIIAYTEASKYVMQVGYKESGRLDDIANELAKNNTTEYNKIIKEVADFLISKGYNKALAETTAKKAFKDTVDAFGALNSKSTFGKLAYQLANGFGEEDAKKYSITELIEEHQDEVLNNIVEKFLDEFINITKGIQLEDGRYVINLQSMFNYILESDEIDINTAAYIYKNINKYIAEHPNNNYIFTGNIAGEYISSKEFFNRLNEDKIEAIESINQLHISPVEFDERSKDYTDALVAAANGAKTTIVAEGVKREFGNVKKDEDDNTVNTHLSVYVTFTKGKQTKTVKIGILRTVQPNSSLNGFYPISHNSGFMNAVIKDADNSIKLDCDFLFEALINAQVNNDTEAKSLLYDLANYIVTIQDISNKSNSGEYTPAQVNKELKEAMSLETAQHILNNKYIQELLRDQHYIIYKQTPDDVRSAKILAESIASILFYGHQFNTTNMTQRAINTLSLDVAEMTKRYNEWKEKVYENYENTYAIQEQLKDETVQVNARANISYHTSLNTIPPGEQHPNIADAGFNIDSNSKTYTPLVMVNNEGFIVDEEGHTYGVAQGNIKPYSLGFLVYNKVNNKVAISHVAYCERAEILEQDSVVKNLKEEFFKLIGDQFDNIDANTHEENFNRIKNSIIELFGYSSLFRFNPNIHISIDKIHNSISIYKVVGKNPDGSNKTITLLGFFDKNNSTNAEESNSNGIQYFDYHTKSVLSINSFDGNSKIRKEVLRDSLEYLINGLTRDVVLNRSLAAVTNTTKSNGSSNYFTRKNGKFVVTLGGKELVYENYGDFVLQNRGFKTNVDGSKGFVVRTINQNRISIDTKTIDPDKKVINNNTFVTDKINETLTNGRKTIDTIDILKAAGVESEIIDILMGTKSGMPISIKTIKIDENDKGDDANMYYSNKDKSIHITPKGAASMNNNPTNTVRLILHENLHRLFHNKGKYSDKERERIIDELAEVYEYTMDSLDRDVESGRISQNLYNAIISVLAKATSSTNNATNMEEFMVECLSQKVLVNYLNNTAYKNTVDISNIEEKHKSIFQKIIDILLDLFRLNGQKLNNNSILAREYQILSKGISPTDNGMLNEPVADNTNTTQSSTDTTPKKYIWTGKEGFVKHQVGDIIQNNVNHKTYTVTKVSTNGNILELVDEDGNVTTSMPSVTPPVEGTTSTTTSSTSSTPTTPATNTGTSSTTSTTATTNTESKTPTVNTELLNQTVNKVDEIAEVFSKRIKRSDNFEEDHTYYIDGKVADTSVTQRVHGKQDLGNIGTAASLLGNTADEASRLYFENNGVVPDEIPNTVEDDEISTIPPENSKRAVVEEIAKIETYLDNKFGKGKYKVITREFPIGGVFNTNGKDQTVAGTMDMIVCTDEGDIYIYDFKTKRLGDNDGNLDAETVAGYARQVNIYRQLIEANFPELKGKIKLGGLIKFNVDYPIPNSTIVYKKDDKAKNQLLVSEDGGKTYNNIQDSDVDYSLPFLLDYSDKVFISVKENDFVDEIKPLPKGTNIIKDNPDDDSIVGSSDYNEAAFDEAAFDDLEDIEFAKTDLIEDLDEIIQYDTTFIKGYDDIDNIANTFLAPNGKPSNLTPEQYRMVRSKKFKAWFGDWENDPEHSSKVLDENGEPLITYHTGANNIKIFNIEDNRKLYKNKFDEDVTKEIFDYLRNEEHFNITKEQEEDYYNGKTIIIKRDNGIYTTDSLAMSSSYRPNFEQYELEDYEKTLYYDIIRYLDDPDDLEYINDYFNIISFIKKHNYNDIAGDLNKKSLFNDIAKEYVKENTADIKLEYRPVEQRKSVGGVYQLFNNIKNPLIVEGDNSQWYDILFEGKKVSTRDLEHIGRTRGYDGVIIKNIKDYGDYSYEEEKDIPNNVYISYSANQVKSVIDNNGEFSTKDNDIYKAATPMITSTEIYTNDITNNTGINSYGVQSVNNMNDYINSFPLQYKAQIRSLIDSGELIYSCR